MMKNKSEELLHLIQEGDVSSIQIMSERLSIEEPLVIEMIEELVETGKLRGKFDSSRQRFFKTDIKISDAPSIPVENDLPEFMKYDTTVGKIISIFGLVVCIFAILLLAFGPATFELENIGMVVLLAGLVIMMIGGYQIGKRKTPL